MRISTKALAFINQHYHSAGDPAAQGLDDLVGRIGAQLGAVEEVIPFGKRFEDVVVARVVSCDDHPNADRLHVCKIDDGGRTEGVERDEQGYVQVVCGAPNVRVGLTVAWLPPGATVPSTYFDTDRFILEARDLRGVTSNGMLASPKELSLSDSHNGILEIDQEVEPGTSFADAFHLRDDHVIDMENKMFTHRPDCFGWLGIAREIEGIYHRPYKSPEWYRMDAPIPDIETDELKLEVRNEIPDLVPRFTAITMRDVKVGQSPVWLQADLARAGIRPINNIVDYTNFFMIETGQPIHAYDYDKVKALSDAGHAVMVIRYPKAGETITTLQGKTFEPRPEAMMVATDEQLICVGGAIGGIDTEVDENTTNIIIEAASWDMFSIRRTSMAHGIFTDAVTRFNKGQSPLQNRAALAKVVDEIRRYADGKVASQFIDDNHLSSEVQARGSVHAPVAVTAEFINSRLGFDLTARAMAELLRNVEFDVEINGASLTVKAPFWRTDIEIPEDVVEEVGRLYGFDHLPLELPERSVTPASKEPLLELKSAIRSCLSGAGANEILTYSFVHGNLLDKVGQDRKLAYQLSNALSPDLQYFRLDLMPSVLDKVSPNLKAGYDEFALFEIGKNHTLLHHADEDGLPKEFDMVALVYTAHDKLAQPGAAFYRARTFLTRLGDVLGVDLQFSPITDAPDVPIVKPYDLARSAFVTVRDSGQFLGILGEFKPAVRKALKLPQQTAGFEIGIKELLEANRDISTYIALPRFPKIEQDICLRVPADMTYEQVYNFAWDKLAEVKPANSLPGLGPVDIYQRPDDPGHRQITLRLSLASYERTLTDDEVSKILDHIAERAAEELGAIRV